MMANRDEAVIGRLVPSLPRTGIDQIDADQPFRRADGHKERDLPVPQDIDVGIGVQPIL